MIRRILAIASMLALFVVTPARAWLQPGQSATDFTRNELVGGAVGPSRMLADYPGRILLVFQLGYSCPICQADAPSVQADFWQHYQTAAPGRVQVIGADMWDGTPAQLQTFRNTTGTTYPLLLMGTTPASGSLQNWGPFDNYVIVSPDGVVRYNAVQQGYAHGSRYQKDRMRALIDSLIASTVGVGDGRPATSASLTASPNPASGAVAIAFRAPGGSGAASVRVLDVVGRSVASLHGSAGGEGEWRFVWDGRRSDGSRAPAGVYLILAESGDLRLTRRIARVR